MEWGEINPDQNPLNVLPDAPGFSMFADCAKKYISIGVCVPGSRFRFAGSAPRCFEQINPPIQLL